jgi:hypothetical protein
MHLVTSRVRDRDQDYILQDPPELSEMEDFDSAEEEIKEMTEVLLQGKTRTAAPVNDELQAMSPLLEQQQNQQIFFIDTEHFLAQSKQEQLWRNADSFEAGDDEL